MQIELFERELINTTINDVSLADYVKKNYVPMSVIEDIKAEIKKPLEIERVFDTTKAQAKALKWCLEIIDKHTKG